MYNSSYIQITFFKSFRMTMTVLVDGEGETEPELNFFALVFFFFAKLISFWFRFLLTVNKYRQCVIQLFTNETQTHRQIKAQISKLLL